MPQTSAKSTEKASAGSERTTPAKAAARTAKRPRARKPSDPELRLTGDRLIVRTPGNGERKSAGGLLIPATAVPAPRRLLWGDVTLVGPDVRVAKTGDQVLFLPQSGLEVELEGEELMLLRERDVQAVQSPKGADRPSGQYL
ncbi:MAG TPA: co-chaperone GroES [Actinomycetota bacterium]|jgi:chaperonin GroES|nr:co-chaperone GroES [Actinomycetota bacterium]